MVLVGLCPGSLDAALPPLCEDMCGPQVACSTPCRASGVRTTCGKYGECSNGAPPCPTVQCAAGCAERPSFTVSNANPVIGETITFTANTSNINPDTANWDLGDGTHVVAIIVDHAYAADGAYRACLKANETTCDTVQSTCKWINVVPDGGGGGGGGCLAGGADVPCFAGHLLRLGKRGALALPAGCRHVAAASGAGRRGRIECRSASVAYEFDAAACAAGGDSVRLPSGVARVCAASTAGVKELVVTLPEHALALRAGVASPESALLLWQLAGSFLP
jgi:PKD repeat protein